MAAKVDPEKRRMVGSLLSKAFQVECELEALSRTRSLTDLEVLRLERAVRRNGARREQWHWTRADDYRLVRHLLRGRKPKLIAILMKRSELSIWTRMRRLGLRVSLITAATGGRRDKCPIAPDAPKCEE